MENEKPGISLRKETFFSEEDLIKNISELENSKENFHFIQYIFF
jgi:hypothetical protein